MIYYIIFTIIFIAVFYSFLETIIDKRNTEWWQINAKRNFPFKWKGKTLWYSRSVAVTLFAFCKNNFGEWCVLANQRGDGTPDYQGYWNCPCGYLDFNENSISAAQRECYEETGIKIPIESIKICEINSEPTENRQNVGIRHCAILNGYSNLWSNFSTAHMESGEVKDIKWIPISEIGKYEWAFNHKELITKYLPE